MERVVAFGPNSALIGVETLPEKGQADPNLPGVILLNAGVVHRIGPHRMTVTLARRLAELGFHVLRFDSSGRGDSSPRERGTPAGAIIADGQAAMDLLWARAGCARFVFGGLCSGADNSVKIALADKRVVGAILLDPYGYRTPRFYLQHLQDRSVDQVLLLRSVERYVRKRVRAWLVHSLRKDDQLGAQSTSKPPPAYRRKQPAKEIFGTQLRSLCDRGVRLLAVYTGSASERYNYAEQFADAFRKFGLDGRVDCRFFKGINHTFTELSSQQVLCGQVTEWLIDAFSPSHASGNRVQSGLNVVGSVLAPASQTSPRANLLVPAEILPGAKDTVQMSDSPPPPSTERAADRDDAPQSRPPQFSPDPVPSALTDSPSSGTNEAKAAGTRKPEKATLIQRQMQIVQSQIELLHRLKALRGKDLFPTNRDRGGDGVIGSTVRRGGGKGTITPS
jgi:hypothetical protein